MNSKQKKRAPLGADTADEGLDLADLVNVAYDRDDSYDSYSATNVLAAAASFSPPIASR